MTEQRGAARSTKTKVNEKRLKNFADDGDEDDEVKCCCCSRNRFYETFFYAFIFLLLLGGLAAIAAGLYLRIQFWHFLEVFFRSVFTVCVYFLIFGGAFNVILGILGVSFAKSKRRCHNALLVVLIGLIISLIIQVAVGAAACIYSSWIDLRIANDLDTVILSYYSPSDTSTSAARFTEAVDTLQRTYRCCGASNYTMWLIAAKSHLNIHPNYNPNSTGLPDSCCISEVVGCAQLVHPSNIYYDGCYELLAHYIRNHLWLVGIVVLGALIYQFFGIWLTFEEYRIKKPALHLHAR